ncbi:MAG TPA: GGDEF domain-containing protein, partial [Pseudothermotoga sp.]
MIRVGKKEKSKGIIRSLLVFVATIIILFLLSKDRSTHGIVVNLAILDLIARTIIMCILFSYSYVLLRLGGFLFAYAKIFSFVPFTLKFYEIEMILEIIGITMIATSLFLLSKNILGDQLFNLAFSDSLTGLMNRHAFLNHVRRILKTPAERDKMAAVIYVDLNKFKFVNDRYGHHVGDQVLETIGRRIKSMVRKG